MMASSKVAIRFRYSLMAVVDMLPASRDTSDWTSSTLSLSTSMMAMAAYGFGPCKGWGKGKGRGASKAASWLEGRRVTDGRTCRPRPKHFWTRGMCSLKDASA